MGFMPISLSIYICLHIFFNHKKKGYFINKVKVVQSLCKDLATTQWVDQNYLGITQDSYVATIARELRSSNNKRANQLKLTASLKTNCKSTFSSCEYKDITQAFPTKPYTVKRIQWKHTLIKNEKK